MANSSAGRANLSMSERHPNSTSDEETKLAASSSGHPSPPKINTEKRKDHSRIIKLKVRVRFVAPSIVPRQLVVASAPGRWFARSLAH